jgi:hypothetical protein
MNTTMSIRLELPIEKRDNPAAPPKISEADTKIRLAAAAMGVIVSRVKVRADVVHLYGTKVLDS